MSIPLNGININGVEIKDTFAEGFEMVATRVLITAINETWAQNAAKTMTGFATSVIGCGVEAGIERVVPSHTTPDGRPGVSVLLFAASAKTLAKQLAVRVGQCVLTCPTTAIFANLEGDQTIPLGDNLRYFGDGYQISKRVGERRYWRIPVMDGEFLCEDKVPVVKAIGGGNFLIMAKSQAQALQACETAVNAISYLNGIILPFPGGGVRSGSKVGSKYKNLIASTHEVYCPTLKDIVDTQLLPNTEAVMEVVIDGLQTQDVINAMRAGMQAVCGLGTAQGIIGITAGNYGGKLGKYQFHLWEVMGGSE